MGGPRPTPTALLKARNSNRAIGRRNEPDPLKGIPDPPPYLDDAGRQHWMRLVPMLDGAGLLGLEYRDSLGDLCHALSQRDKIAVVMNELIAQVSSADEDLAATLKELRKISDATFARCAKGYALFGMSPADRVRVAPKWTKEDKTKGKTKARFFERAG